MSSARTLGRLAIVAVGAAAFVAIGVALFVVVPGSLTELLGIVLALVVGVIGVKLAGSVAASLLPDYDVAEVAIEGPISRNGGGGLPTTPRATTADDVVEQIDRANDDDTVDALLLRLNTPGGEVVPSDDIKLAVERFEGPTIAYATDTCASGGYWIASGCDELWARDATLVGSIGVIGSRVTAADLADKVGLNYERLAAGEYKDAGLPIKEMSEDERAYLQGLVDDYYEDFVERVSEGRDLDPSFVRDTEARVYLGEEATDLGLVDDLGTRQDVEERVAERLGTDSVSVEEFEPERPLMQRVGGTAARVAYALGAGIAGRGERGFRLRT